jgi:hypothetical protein
MKKLVFLALIALVGQRSAFAQVQFGVKAGYNLASVHISNESSSFTWKSKSDLHAGVLVNIPLLAGLSVQPEAVYSGQGAKINDDGDDITLGTGLINIPVMVQYSYKGVFVETGPQLGFLISAKEKEKNFSQDIKSDLKSTEIAWGAGLGYKSKIGLGIDARYNFGIGNIAKSATEFDSFGQSARNGVFQIGLFWLLWGAKK